MVVTVSIPTKGVVVHGAGAARAPGTSCFSIPRLDASTALAALDLAGVAASSGAACTTGAVTPSHVLLALGIPEALARCALRVSFGRTNTEDEARRVVALLEEVTARLHVAPIGGVR